MTFCHCTAYLTNPGGRCCRDLWGPVAIETGVDLAYWDRVVRYLSTLASVPEETEADEPEPFI